VVRTSSSNPLIIPPYEERTHRAAIAFQTADEGTKESIEAMLAEPMPVQIDDGHDDWQRAALAYKHELIGTLDRIVDEIQTGWAERMARGLLHSENTVDQREIDYRRGWYQGARYALRVIPYRAHRRLQKEIATREEVSD
jgi:hypothetical protein